MSPHRRRLVWLLAVGVAQLMLVAAAEKLCLVTSRAENRTLAGSWVGLYGTDAIYLGYPVPWEENRQPFTDWMEPQFKKTLSGPVELFGRNLAVPVVLFAIAVCAPPVVAAYAGRRPRPPASRVTRGLCVVLVASLFALIAAWVEVETMHGSAFGTPWKEYPPGAWAAATETYQEVDSAVSRGRFWLADRLPAGVIGDDWAFRTRLTIAAFAAGAVFASVLLRPWQRAAANEVRGMCDRGYEKSAGPDNPNDPAGAAARPAC
jgi:hypothetical protein